MTEEVFEILRSAVNVARFNNIRRLPALRSILYRQSPGKDAQIDEALSAWSAYTHSRKEPQ